MAAARNRAFASTSLTLLSLVVGALALAVSGSPGVVKAQGRQGAPGLEAQKDRLLPLFETAGVVFTDADETNGRLVVGVLDRGVEGLIRGRLNVLGVSSQSVDIVEAPAIFEVATLRDKVRPVVGGLQIRFSQYVCSLGFNAEHTSGSGFVTAAHCSSRQGEVDGTEYYQPLNKVPDELIGTETIDPPFFRDGCPRGKKCRYSDANFSQAANGATFTRGGIARTTGPNNGSLEIAGQFSITATGEAQPGEEANKVGRTTGWTLGQVSRTCVDTSVSGSNVLLLCQVFVEAGKKQGQIVAGGDSGSPVFKVTGTNTATLFGGLWGGNGSGSMFVYSPIAKIEQELGNLTTH